MRQVQSPRGRVRSPAKVEGKLSHALLQNLLGSLTPPGREVIIGPKVGEDAFAARVGETIVVASTDPITFTTHEIGYYLVNVNANDVATMGAAPRWLLATALFPPGTSQTEIAGLFAELDRACVEVGARLCGGHTEVTSSVTRPVVVGTMIGFVAKGSLVRPQRVRPGDRVLLTKRLAIEGTAILARERPQQLKRVVGATGLAKARKFLHDPGISVVREALLAVKVASVHAMHDPTEGGLIWGLKELSLASGKGIEVDFDDVPIYPETKAICDYFGINPLGLIASGSLLIVVTARDSIKVRRSLKRAGIECSDIGVVKGRGVTLRKGGRRIPLPEIKCDEIARILGS